MGYRLTTKNAQPVEEHLTLSKAMQPCSDQILSALALRRLPNETLNALLERNRTEFLDYATSGEYRLKSNELFINTQIQSRQTLTLPTRCYAVEFNDDLVTISLLK